MGQVLRTVLICLLALAVPAQGMAAATMLHCGPGHHGAQAAHSKVQALPDLLQALPGGREVHGHELGHASDPGTVSDIRQNATLTDAPDAAQTDNATDAVKAVKTASQKCSACASCCGALALPGSAAMPPMVYAARETTALALPVAASVVVDGPERPPRHLRA